MIIGRFSPREVDKMSLWECTALTAYHNYHHAKDEDIMLSENELADIEADVAAWEKEP
jgi:hypothetical protein